MHTPDHCLCSRLEPNRHEGSCESCGHLKERHSQSPSPTKGLLTFLLRPQHHSDTFSRLMKIFRESRSALHLPSPSLHTPHLSAHCSRQSLLFPRKSHRDSSTHDLVKEYIESLSTAASVYENEQIDLILQGKKSPNRVKSPYKRSISPSPSQASPVSLRKSPKMRPKSPLIRRLKPETPLKYSKISVQEEYLVGNSVEKNSQMPVFTLFSSGNLHKNAISGIEITQNGKILTTGIDYCGGIWTAKSDKMTGKPTKKLHKGPILSLFSSKNRVITGGTDGTIRIWDPGLCDLQRLITLKNESIRCIIGAGDEKIVTSGSNSELILWDLETGRVEVRFERSNCRGVFALWRVSREVVVSGGGDGVVQVWDMREAAPTVTIHSHTDTVSSFASSDFSLYSGSYDHSIRLFDLRYPAFPPRIIYKNAPVTAVTIIDSRLLACSEDGVMEMEGCKGGVERTKRPIKEVKYWEERRWLVTGDGEGIGRVYAVGNLD